MDCEEVLSPSEHVVCVLNLYRCFVCVVGIYTGVHEPLSKSI